MNTLATPPARKGGPLAVPWYSQKDSATGQANRMCFSSSCAMLLEYLKPGTLIGPNGDDQYLRAVNKFGDSTSPAAQVRALREYGIDASFATNGTFRLIEQQIDAGIPVPVGWLHRGPISAPSGGGHWAIIVGYTPSAVIVHDPFGEADLISGATLPSPARFMAYSRKNFGRRWMVDDAGNYRPGQGWAIIAKQ